uniref:Uncharacterized protein n=1 Tax=Triticum urartu TaxID=4572 RepID=A0A8R7QZ07_TRIUA
MKRRSWGDKASTMTMATVETVQEPRCSMVGHTMTSTCLGSIESMREARHSLVGHAPTTLVATVETVQEAWCFVVGHIAAPTRSGSVESVREARLTTIGGDLTSKSDEKNDKDSAFLGKATLVSAAPGTTTLGREFPGNAKSDKSSTGSEFLGSMTSDTTTPGREFPGSVTSGTMTPARLMPTSEVVAGQFMSPPTARSDLFDADNNVGAPHRFRRLGGSSRRTCGTTAAPRDQEGRARRLHQAQGTVRHERLRTARGGGLAGGPRSGGKARAGRTGYTKPQKTDIPTKATSGFTSCTIKSESSTSNSFDKVEGEIVESTMVFSEHAAACMQHQRQQLPMHVRKW